MPSGTEQSPSPEVPPSRSKAAETSPPSSPLEPASAAVKPANGLSTDPELIERIETELVQRLQVSIQRASWSSILPPPDALEQYARLNPDISGFLIEEARASSAHFRDLQRIALTGEIQQKGRGQFLGFAVAVLGIAVSAVAALMGHDTYACVLGGGTLTSVVAIFVTGRKLEKQPDRDTGDEHSSDPPKP